MPGPTSPPRPRALALLAALAAVLPLAAGCAGPAALAAGLPAAPDSPAACGVEVLGLRLRSAGYLVELRFKVVDAARAAPLFDPRARLELEPEGAAAGVAPLQPPLAPRWPAGSPQASQVYTVGFDATLSRLAAGGRAAVRLGPLLVRGLAVAGE